MAEWNRTFTVADWAVIDALAPEVREVVDRYAASGVVDETGKTEAPMDEYHRGYEDGFEEGAEDMRDEIGSAYVRPPPRERRENAKRRKASA